MKKMTLRQTVKFFTIVIFCSFLIGKGSFVLRSDCNCDDPIFIDFLKPDWIEDEKHDKGFPVRNVDRSALLLFTQATPQTELSPEVTKKLNRLFPGENTIERIGKVLHWVKDNFGNYRARGAKVAKQNAQQLYDDRKLERHEDWGLLLTAILRSLNFPVVFVSAANIDWAKQYRENPLIGMSRGATFLEVYVEDRWVLISPSRGEYIEDYDYDNPVLHLDRDFFVYKKGLDQWTMGITSVEDNIEIMKDFALNYPLDTISIQKKDIKSFFHKVSPEKRREKDVSHFLEAAAPDFSLVDLNGLTHTLADYQGKVLFINFWATWCAPCRREIPDFIKAYQDHASEGLVILGVSVDRLAPAKLADWVKRAEINYPVALATEQMRADYHPGSGIPVTIVIDKTGRIRNRHVGILKKDELVNIFKELAAE